MNEYQQVVNNFKSDLLTKCVQSVMETYTIDRYYKVLSDCLLEHFGIEYSSFLLKEADMMQMVYNSAFNTSNIDPIPYSLFEPYFLTNSVEVIPNFLSEKEPFNGLTHITLLKQGENKLIYVFKQTDLFEGIINSKYFNEVKDSIISVTISAQYLTDIRLNENQYRKLYTMTELFHSTMDIDKILKNVLVTIEENFPDFNCELILSNDQDRQTTIKIKPFDYLSERPSTIEAFVSGELTIERVKELNCNLLNAPIKGRQAIYGILQVSAPIGYNFSMRQKEFVRMLAQTSGNALENAKLYHQSHRLISDLQLINETSHRLNMRLNIDEMLVFLKKQLVKSFQPSQLAFVFRVNGKYDVTSVCTDVFKSEEGESYLFHAQSHFESSQDPLFIADFSRLLTEDLKYKSMMAIPMIVEEKINGYSIVLHEEPYFFSFDSFKLMQSLIHHSSLAISNSILRNQLQEMVDRDHLTQLYARSYLDSYVERSLVNDESGMFMLIDIDNFKRINDNYGHHVGDQVLVQIGVQLKKSIGTRGICARWGGEELSIYIPNILHHEAIKIAESIVDVIPKATDPQVTISAGLITWDKSTRPEFKSVFLQADTALYTAKNNGKNQVCIFDESVQLQL